MGWMNEIGGTASVGGLSVCGPNPAGHVDKALSACGVLDSYGLARTMTRSNELTKDNSLPRGTSYLSEAS